MTRDVLCGNNIGTKRALMQDAGGDGAYLKLAKWKIDALGAITSHSGLVNAEGQLAKLTNKLMLAASMATTDNLDKAATEKKQAESTDGLLKIATGGKSKLAATNGDVKGRTKKEICSLMLACYGTKVDESKLAKPILVTMLSEKIAANGEAVLVSQVATMPAAEIV